MKIAKDLAKAKTEEAVKAAFVRHYKLAFNSEARVDLLAPPVLFEFKLDLNMAKKWPVVLAQALYYTRRIRDESAEDMPVWIALIDKNEGALIAVAECMELLNGDFDWERAPSSPCPKLIEAVGTRNVPVYHFDTDLETFLGQLESALASEEIVARPITEHNFQAVYKAWARALGLEGQNLGALFVADVCKEVWFDEDTGELAAKDARGKTQVPVKAYKQFWSAYKRPPTVKARKEIKARRDRLRAIDKRRFEGEFFTPPLFCEKTVECLDKALGEDWQDEYTVWDPCAGTGNLLWPLRIPGERVFASTLHKEDVAAMDWYEGATVFQFDFLNDPVEKLPENLREALKAEKVLVLMNPPYAEAGSGGPTTECKTGVKSTLVSKQLADVGLGGAANELFVQFFWRVNQLCPQATVAMFAKLKYINAPAFEKFRKQVLDQYAFKGGMIFPAKVFHGTKGSWPVSFGIWEGRDND